ncbi:bifunctional copper resistance protein CopD/cytochrome c oxidase assembly protein [Beutenbergia cavernae]|uniref:bifunctional copper resistance protein CopD/cytochrome c oxidase assembly protein n=1 Tax=Beutenbergia cavernae TaxID=84757 RepID=UPI00019AC834|nr:bifunctional copper resistance protein CopD/cytochrome c oxidase assembly protein [Beutenbergia cavernae]
MTSQAARATPSSPDLPGRTGDGEPSRGAALAVRAAIAAVPVAVVAGLLGIAFSGAALPEVIADPGALVRWGLPVVTTVVQLTTALTIGALVMCAVVLPRAGGPRETHTTNDSRPHTVFPRTSRRTPTPDGAAWRRAQALAAGAAVAWTLAAVVQLVFTYANTAGRPLGGENFGEELGYYVTQIEAGRSGLVGVVMVGVTAVLAVGVGGYTSAAWTGVAALAALAPTALTGHAAGAASHDLAVSSLWLHLVGVTLWAGGLAVLCLTANRTGRDLPDAVARYSALAIWAYALVAISGVVNAWIRIGGLDGLATRYGVLVLVKAALLVVLGAAGWWHRRSTIPALRASAAAGTSALRTAAFWRLAAGEVVVMGAVMGVAVALGSSAPPVPQTPSAVSPAELITGRPVPPEPTALRWFTEFSPDVLFGLLALAGIGVYLGWVWRLRHRGDAWSWPRTVSWLAGLVLFAWVTNGGAAVYGHILFSAHMVQHMMLVMVVPIFLVLGAPVTLALRALPSRSDGSRGPREWLLALVSSRVAAFFSNPIIAAVNFAGSMIVFYFTGLFELALTSHVGHVAMVVHFSLAGYLFVNALIGIDPGPKRPAYPFRLLLLFATMAFHAFFGLALTTMTALIAADYFGGLGLPWGVDAIADQQQGGAITWGIGEIPSLVLAIAIAIAWSRDDERLARRTDRAADRDGDAQLAEYNAMLARLAEDDRKE